VATSFGGALPPAFAGVLWAALPESGRELMLAGLALNGLLAYAVR
jgi:hypothetical protein